MNYGTSPSEYGSSDASSAIAQRLGGMVRDMGLDHFSFVMLRGADPTVDVVDATFRTSYPNEWVDRYRRQKYWQVDPVTILSQKIIRPFFWSHGPFLDNYSRSQRLVFDEAGVFGINWGMTIPVRGTRGELSAFSVVSSRKSQLEEAVHDCHVRMFAAAFDTHELVLKELPEMGREGEAAIPLSPREKECLSWTLEGKTAGEIATILGISTSTVNQHVARASHKLGSLNKHHAAVQALRLNLIH